MRKVPKPIRKPVTLDHCSQKALLIIVEWNVLGIVLFNREIIEFPLG
jgi:hypothetical protein